jgi:LemA protein
MLSLVGMVGGLLVLALVFYGIILFNGFVQLKFLVEKAWANIDVLLKQRHDEVPNLVACVQGAAGFEQKVMENVTLARAGTLDARSVGDKAKAEAALSAAVGKLFAVAENYPQLKSTENFLALQRRLSSLRTTSRTDASSITIRWRTTTSASNNSLTFYLRRRSSSNPGRCTAFRRKTSASSR